MLSRTWMGTFAERTTRGSKRTEEDIELMCRQLGVQVGNQEVATVAQMRRDFTRRQMVPRDGALETLTELRAKGLKLGLISDCTIEVPQLWPETGPRATLRCRRVFVHRMHQEAGSDHLPSRLRSAGCGAGSLPLRWRR